MIERLRWVSPVLTWSCLKRCRTRHRGFTESAREVVWASQERYSQDFNADPSGAPHLTRSRHIENAKCSQSNSIRFSCSGSLCSHYLRCAIWVYKVVTRERNDMKVNYHAPGVEKDLSWSPWKWEKLLRLEESTMLDAMRSFLVEK